MKTLFLATILFLSGLKAIQAQHSSPNKDLILRYQDTIKMLSYESINNPDEAERYSSSYKMIRTLIKALKTPNSFNFGFDSVKTISIQLSPDRRFRIFSWHVMNNNGSYRYYGTIQMNTPGSSTLKMLPLIDHTEAIKNPQDTLTTNENWFGAQYYKIIPVTANVRSPYYILLGWKGNTVKTTRKVIEVLQFKDDKAYFGLPVFEGNKDLLGKKRVIFEYNRQVSMMLNYQPKERMIVFDHLAAPDPRITNKPELMGPDMSYDGFKLSNGRWKFVQDLELKNAPSELDDSFIDPTKALKEKVNKLN
ncbi:hypothetical protein [Desertivirga xinjiangensis]|uniref:hypothetical protein n=1 Tax=Desertivirga xinjiangensis TaxID=539206 RepID=UPI0021092899|nr:hypothetical protein [Pedobacter xinjiangensis]